MFIESENQIKSLIFHIFPLFEPGAGLFCKARPTGPILPARNSPFPEFHFPIALGFVQSHRYLTDLPRLLGKSSAAAPAQKLFAKPL